MKNIGSVAYQFCMQCKISVNLFLVFQSRNIFLLDISITYINYWHAFKAILDHSKSIYISIEGWVSIGSDNRLDPNRSTINVMNANTRTSFDHFTDAFGLVGRNMLKWLNYTGRMCGIIYGCDHDRKILVQWPLFALQSNKLWLTR